MLVCSQQSRFAERSSVGWKEIVTEKLGLLTPENQNRRIINRHFREAGVTPDAWIESDSLVALVANVENSEWLTILPADIAAFLIQGKALRLVHLSGTTVSPSVGLVAPYREPHTPTLQALLNEARHISNMK